ncbi:alpha/beta hydrolase [Bifidobacterium mongoliense]|uniref:alpha/beta hydrolase n=1 Tax=Bifidobacterium mongoliense TaxID=518643 RepID=UPI0030EC79BF
MALENNNHHMQVCPWAPIDEDLDGIGGDVRKVAIRTRRHFASGVDSIRSKEWADPDGVDVFADVPYMDDGGAGSAAAKAHALDVYLPHEARLRGGHALPVVIEIHGGGFVYGYKDLNRNFGTHLAAEGFAVFSLGYRLAPAVDFLDQLDDLIHAVHWLRRYAINYPVDSSSIFIVGDSAGATLGAYLAAIMSDESLAAMLGFEPTELTAKGAMFISGLFDVKPLMHPTSGPSVLPYLDEMGGALFDSFAARVPARMLTMEGLAETGALPPVLLTTSSDDFLESENLFFAGCLRRNGRSCEIRDFVPQKGLTLGHVFPVGQVCLPESKAVFKGMRAFAYDRIVPHCISTN